MRFRIECPNMRRTYYRLFMQNTCIEVQGLSDRLSWMWHDGTHYAIIASLCHADRPSYWCVVKENEVICSRQVTYPTWRKSLSFLRYPQTAGFSFKWEFKDQLVFVTSGNYCCRLFPRSWSLKYSDGKQLAFWRARKGGFEGVWRNTRYPDILPIIFGMTLAEIHDDYLLLGNIGS